MITLFTDAYIHHKASACSYMICNQQLLQVSINIIYL